MTAACWVRSEATLLALWEVEMKAFSTVAALFLLAAPAFAGAAETAAQQPQVRVQRDDLDLTRTEDARVLLARLDDAADRVCASGLVDRPSNAARRAIEACRKEALAEIVARLDAPEVARLYAARD